MTSRLSNGRPRQFCVIWQNRRCSILFHLLVPGGKWQTLTGSPNLVRQLLQGHLPQAAANPIATTAIRRDQQPLRLWETLAAHPLPPTTDARHRKLGRVVINAHAHPALIVRQVVNPVRDRLAQLFIFEVVTAYLRRLTGRAPLTSGVLEIAQILLLFAIHGDRWLLLSLPKSDLIVDVAELGVSIRVIGGPLVCLAVGLQAVAGFVQQSSYRARADGVSLAGQFVGQVAGALAGPTQGRLRVPSGEGIDQLVQSSQQPRVDFRTRFASRTGPADTVDGMWLPRGGPIPAAQRRWYRDPIR